jgi:hypothetical protein
LCVILKPKPWNIEINHNEIIDLERFQLGLEMETHNPNISELKKIKSSLLHRVKRIYKVIKHYEGERFLMEKLSINRLISANQESAEKLNDSVNQMKSILKPGMKIFLINCTYSFLNYKRFLRY